MSTDEHQNDNYEPEGWRQYREWVWKRAFLSHTNLDPQTRHAYLALGLCGESTEALKATSCNTRIDETGDVAWHLAMIEALTGHSMPWHPKPILSRYTDQLYRETIDGVRRYACAYAECVKRPLLGRPFPADRATEAMANLAYLFVNACHMLGGLEIVLRHSVEKNIARYGEVGYNPAHPSTHTAEADRLTVPPVSFVLTDYHSNVYRPYRNVLHDPVSDRRVRYEDALELALAGTDASDGDEVIITVRKTGRRPFGVRKLRWVRDGVYEREPVNE